MRPKIILLADSLSAENVAAIRKVTEGWASFAHPPQRSPQVVTAVSDADILIGWGEAELLRSSKVSTYLCGSAGIDAYVGHGLDVKPGFSMANAAGVMSVTIAEHCVAMMFVLVRQIPVMVRQQVAKHYARRWHGGEVFGSSACIVGFGQSGLELAKRLVALGLTVTGVRRSSGPVPAGVRQMYTPADFHIAVAQAKHVFCLLPGGAATRQMFNSQAFDAMSPGSFFYNASRGTNVDEQALISALSSGRLGGAGLDVFEREPLDSSSPLWDMENVLISPHTAGHSAMLATRLTNLFVRNLQNCRDGRPLVNAVDLRLLR